MEPDTLREDMPLTTERKRGFAILSAERRTEIARQGGQISHARGRAHEFSRDEAREAGRKGGRAVSGNRQHMATIGRAGGHASQVRRREQATRALG
jgi:uncharacterized protein